MSTSTITTAQEATIRNVLATMPELAVGIGTRERACSFAAINLALTGILTDAVPDCASAVIWRWGIGVQDRAPASVVRDNPRWRAALPLAAGTGRAHEVERRALVIAWMWDALVLVQPRADAGGYGKAWRAMCEERTKKAARDAVAAAVAADAAVAVTYADAAAWQKLDPCGLLERLIAVGAA